MSLVGIKQNSCDVDTKWDILIKINNELICTVSNNISAQYVQSITSVLYNPFIFHFQFFLEVLLLTMINEIIHQANKTNLEGITTFMRHKFLLRFHKNKITKEKFRWPTFRLNIYIAYI